MKSRNIVIFIVTVSIAVACGQKQPETTVTTPQDREFAELNAFMDVLEDAIHAVIDSNFTSLRENAAQMTDACRTLEKAPLPKFHQDVAHQFAEVQPALTAAVDNFTAVADTGTDEELAAAVDSVRSAFIDVWSVFVPNIKAIEDFHKVLQPAWHTYTVNEQWEDLKTALSDFEDAIFVLDTTTLPAKYAYARDKFETGVDHLKTAFDSLKFAYAENRLDHLAEKMGILHDAFHELQDFYK